MNKYIYRLSASFMAILTLTGCSDNMDEPSVEPGTDLALKVRGAGIEPHMIADMDELNVYQFDDAHLLNHSVLRQYDPSSIGLKKGSTSSLYCVAGTQPKADENTTPSVFAKSVISTPEGEQSAPLFYSGFAEVGESQMACELTLRRGVARIDLDARDAEMEISEIVVEDAPAASYIFATEAGKLDAPAVSYTYAFDTAPDYLEEGVFMLFESAKEVHVTVHGKTRGEEITIPAVLSSVERNKIYTLRVYDRNVELAASFSISDWEEGGSIDGSPDTSRALLIDQALSVIPSGVTVDYSRNLIELPASGVKDMVLAFNADLRVNLDTMILTGERVEIDSVRQKYIKIEKKNPETTDKGIVTRYVVNVSEQLKARPGYEIKLEVRKPNTVFSSDNVTIRVAESPYQIQTVEIAGVEWMAFNATTPALDDQIFPLLGKSIEETYQEAWVSTVGNFFQFGRQKAYSPWTSNDPNGNEDVERNIPWAAAEAMPLPEGYHVATSAEWSALLPVGTTIPSTYTAGNGETLKVEVIEYPGTLNDSPSADVNKANFRKRCLRFESQATGNVLLIPIVGMKSNNWAANPSWLGDRAGYWMAQDRNVAYFVLSNNNGVFSSSQSQDKWNYNGFLPTRGVKNK